jgi:hypothetical protein
MDRSVIDELCALPGRGACTDAERRAASALHDELRARGEEAFVEARWVRPQRGLSIALHAALAVVAALLSAALPLPAAIAAGFAALSLATEATGRAAPLALLAVRRATQHVLTETPREPGRPVSLLIVAGYDAPREPTALGRRLGGMRAHPAAWLAGAAAVVALTAAARTRDVDGAWLGIVALLATVVLLLGAAAQWEARAKPWTRGAGRAAGTALAIALLAELRREPPHALAPALLLAGAREAGPQSLRSHLRADRARAHETVVLELGPLGPATPWWGARHAQLRGAGARAASALGLQAPSHAPRPPAGTRRLPAIAVASAGPAASGPDAIDDARLDAALDLALAVVDALDAELAPVEEVSA